MFTGDFIEAINAGRSGIAVTNSRSCQRRAEKGSSDFTVVYEGNIGAPAFYANVLALIGAAPY